MTGRSLILPILVACGPRSVPPTQPWQVQIVAPIPQSALTKVTCYLPETPKAPDILRFNYENADIMDRSMVHVRDFNALVGFGRDMVMWASMHDQCIRKLVEANKSLIEIKPFQGPSLPVQLPSRSPSPATAPVHAIP